MLLTATIRDSNRDLDSKRIKLLRVQYLYILGVNLTIWMSKISIEYDNYWWTPIGMKYWKLVWNITKAIDFSIYSIN